MGVSITRSQPNFASNPSLVLNAPPYTPTSSPISTTVGSRSISSNIACLIASRKVTCAISVLPFSPPQPQVSSQVEPIFSHYPSLRYSQLQLLPFARAFPCLQSESARFLGPILCRFQSLPRSTPPERSTSAASLRQPAAPTSHESCGNRRRCNKRHAPQIPPAASVNFPRSRALSPAAR